MSRRVQFTVMVGVLALGFSDFAAEAANFHPKRGTPPPGPPRQFENTLERAGYPLCISPHAVPTYTPDYAGYYVGGGNACGGHPRRAEEGTWGRDYEGTFLPRHVFLGWSHGRRYQGGTGSYRTDGPQVRDPIGLAVGRFRNN